MSWSHPSFIDRWNEYKDRQYIGHMLDRAHFNGMLECDENGKSRHCIDSLGAGCLDAPDDIPFGSSMLVMTIGGWEREEYNRRSRELMHLSLAHIQESNSRVAQVLKNILAKAERD